MEKEDSKRKSGSNSKLTSVYYKHFAERFLIRTFDFIGKNGERELRPYPKLTDDAYPTIFLNLSAHLSSSVPSVRKNPDQRRQAREQRDNDYLKEYLDSDCISRFDILQANITAKVAEYDTNNVWQVVLRDKVIYVHTFNCSSEYFLAVATSFAVREDMSVSLFCIFLIVFCVLYVTCICQYIS